MRTLQCTDHAPVTTGATPYHVPAEAGARDELYREAAIAALADYASRNSSLDSGLGIDAGPAVLAGLCSTIENGSDAESLGAAVRTWMQHISAGSRDPALCGGLGGLLLGAGESRSVYPQMSALADSVRSALSDDGTSGLWQTSNVAWEDYDLISGPAGVLLALDAGNGSGTELAARWVSGRPGRVPPAVTHLVALCDNESLDGLRMTDNHGDPRSLWGVGLVNTGLAHGVAGVAAALRAVAQTPGHQPGVTAALRRVCDWLVRQSGRDRRGVITWEPAGRAGVHALHEPARRQAWCYGTPGISWVLWDCGRLLDDNDLADFALASFESYCAAFDPDFYLDPDPVSSTLGVCHGAAGILAVADAFALHARAPEAEVLGGDLEALLLSRLVDVSGLAASDMSLLTGASGILAVLLSRTSDRRGWLRALALR